MNQSMNQRIDESMNQSISQSVYRDFINNKNSIDLRIINYAVLTENKSSDYRYIYPCCT